MNRNNQSGVSEVRKIPKFLPAAEILELDGDMEADVESDVEQPVDLAIRSQPPTSRGKKRKATPKQTGLLHNALSSSSRLKKSNNPAFEWEIEEEDDYDDDVSTAPKIKIG